MSQSVSHDLDQLGINTVRILSIDMSEKARSGHLGLPLGAAPMAYTLWDRILRHNHRGSCLQGNPSSIEILFFPLTSPRSQLRLAQHLTGISGWVAPATSSDWIILERLRLAKWLWPRCDSLSTMCAPGAATLASGKRASRCRSVTPASKEEWTHLRVHQVLCSSGAALVGSCRRSS
jgi:hypothetical protein